MSLITRIMLISVVVVASMVVEVQAQQDRPRLDPTRPPDSLSRPPQTERDAVDSAPRMKLSSIFYQEGNARAYIDGAFYQEGDRIGQWRVRRINPERVELVRGNERVDLRVFNFQEMTRSKELE